MPQLSVQTGTKLGAYFSGAGLHPKAIGPCGQFDIAGFCSSSMLTVFVHVLSHPFMSVMVSVSMKDPHSEFVNTVTFCP